MYFQAVADALTAEAVYQIVRGNPIGALTDLESIAAGSPPPELRVTETPRSGIRLAHRIALALPADATAPGWQSRVTPRSRVEPLLDAWCGLVLGPADAIVLAVERSGTTVNVPLSTLGVGAIDVVMAGRDDASELAERVVAASRPPDVADAKIRRDAAWTSLIGVCQAAARVITRSEVLRPDVFEPPSVLPSASPEAAGDLPQRVDAARAQLESAHQALLSRQGLDAAVATASLFGIRVPGLSLGGPIPPEQQEALVAAIETRLQGSATGAARDRLRSLFGGDLPGVVSFLPPDPSALATLASPAPASLLASDPLAPSAWLDAVGRVHSRAGTLAEVLLRKEIASGVSAAPLRIAQVPWKDGDRWIATAFTSASRQPATGRLSVLIHAPAGLNTTASMGGLLVDAWTDTIPDPVRDTAMALRFNNASTRAPQTILLAVNPNPAQAWTTDVLVDVLLQTLTLARLRVQPATLLSRGGLMPFAWLGQRPGSTGISFSI